jgi:hypothetical protein
MFRSWISVAGSRCLIGTLCACVVLRCFVLCVHMCMCRPAIAPAFCFLWPCFWLPVDCNAFLSAGYILHADIALAHACYLHPTLETYVKYSLLVLSELLSLERAANLLKHAVDFIHDKCILGLLLEGPAAWDTLTRGNNDEPSPADRDTLATHQIATLIVLMTQIFRFSQLRLQVLLRISFVITAAACAL